MQLFLALRFYTTTNYQAVTGDLKGFLQPTACRSIKTVSIAFPETIKTYIHFSQTIKSQLNNNIKKIYDIANFPNVAACIDDTLINIACPVKAFRKIFRCRKRFFALNLLVAYEPRDEILYLDVRHPESTHGSICFDRSALKMYFEGNLIRGLLLGYNGYLCKPTKSLIERIFGQWKRSFSSLSRNILNRLDNSIASIYATTVLQNPHVHINHPNDDLLCTEEDIQNIPYLEVNPAANGSGLDYRLVFLLDVYDKY